MRLDFCLNSKLYISAFISRLHLKTTKFLYEVVQPIFFLIILKKSEILKGSYFQNLNHHQ